MMQEDFDANLVGNGEVEVWILISEVSDELRFGGSVGGDQRDWPRPLVGACPPLCGQGFTGLDGLVGTTTAGEHRPFLGIDGQMSGHPFVAEDRGDELGEE